jgi:hypothetical protein
MLGRKKNPKPANTTETSVDEPPAKPPKPAIKGRGRRVNCEPPILDDGEGMDLFLDKPAEPAEPAEEPAIKPKKHPDEYCHICKRTFKHDAIVVHIKHVHKIPQCTRETIDTYNRSDDETAETLPDKIHFIGGEQVSKEEFDAHKAKTVPPPATVWSFREDDGHTIDAYLADRDPACSTMGYHKRWLTACVACISNSSVYVGKMRIDGKIYWVEMTRRRLVEKPMSKSAKIMHDGKTKEWQYSRFIDVPKINQLFERYDRLDYVFSPQ